MSFHVIPCDSLSIPLNSFQSTHLLCNQQLFLRNLGFFYEGYEVKGIQLRGVTQEKHMLSQEAC